MHNNRLKLNQQLCDILESDNVYFQPPPSIQMNYPAIVYHRSSIENSYAGNNKYFIRDEYQITLLDWNPESSYIDKILSLPYCELSNTFTKSNLNHFVFTLSY